MSVRLADISVKLDVLSVQFKKSEHSETWNALFSPSVISEHRVVKAQSEGHPADIRNHGEASRTVDAVKLEGRQSNQGQ